MLARVSSLFAAIIMLCGMSLAALAASTTDGNLADPSKRRVALVIGNSAYQHVPALKNAVQDSRDIANVLGRLGFDVTHATDLDKAGFETVLAGFTAKAAGASTALFYYSGHGFQLSSVNYLVPVDAKLDSTGVIDASTVRLDRVIGGVHSNVEQSLIFLDACRDNPLPASVRTQVQPDGLAQIDTGDGTFIAFATQPGNVSYDGAGTNSPFTRALIQHMETPSISISDMMIRVRNDVRRATLQQQTPWDQSSLRSQFYFNPQGGEPAELSDAEVAELTRMDPDLLAKLGIKVKTADEAQAGGSELASARNVEPAPAEIEIEIIPDVVPGDIVPAPAGDTIDIVGDPASPGDNGETLPQRENAKPTTQKPVEVAAVNPDATTGRAADAPGTVAVRSTDAGQAARTSGVETAATGGGAVRVTPTNGGAGQAAGAKPTQRITGVEVAALPDASTPVPDDLPEELSGAELHSALQVELKRVGCYGGAIDGDWGRGSEAATENFLDEIGAESASTEPSGELLARLKDEDDAICEVAAVSPAQQDPAPVVAPTKPRAKKKTDDNKAVSKPRPPKQEAAKPRPTKPKPVVKKAPRQPVVTTQKPASGGRKITKTLKGSGLVR